MARFKNLIARARDAAQSHLPDEVLEAGRKIRNTVVEHAPDSVKDAIERYAPEETDPAEQPESEGPVPDADQHPLSDPDDPDDARVIVYATLEERESVDRIRAVFAKHDIRVREIDLAAQPKMARQIAGDTGVFVPPYVFIGGRFWGAEFDIISLDSDGDLMKVVEGRLDEISESAKRIGHVHESFSDALTAENIIERLKLGHILCVDDLDCWYETDKDGERLFYQGAPRPAEDLQAVAEEIAQGAEQDELSAQWRFDVEVHLHG